jgi:uncharacterized phage protein (TIGR01671 family)
MRDKAFRVYDKRLKVMRKDVIDSNDAPGNNIIIQFTDGEWSLCTKTGYGYDTPCNKKNAILMQYSGVNDDNGIPIFEDDVVQIMVNGKPHNARVVFNEGCFCLAMNAGVYAEGMYTLKELRFMCVMLEVVGNIHDNPELLEVK